MSLEVLNIKFQSSDEFINEVRGALFDDSHEESNEKEILFDSMETFKRLVSQNKIEILNAIAQLKPESVYQLEKLLSRIYPHVLKDCKLLESLGFIKLVESNSKKKQLRPELAFEYDIIKVNSDIGEVFPISERSKRILLEAHAG